jgi:hypothetical protein
MYVTVQRGDQLPTVALAQARLVEFGTPDLKVDGNFGSKTHAAVLAFQRRVAVPTTGAVDQTTWGAMARGLPLSVVDVIDASDIVVLQEDFPHLNDGHSRVQVNYGMSRGALVLINKLVAENAPRSVGLLRLHGHGGPGKMLVSGNIGSSTFAGGHFTQQNAVAYYRLLGQIMKPYGSIEMHGCSVALGAKGRRLLAGLAETCGVPVTAGLGFQRGGTEANRFEGPTSTSLPFGLTLQTWASRVFAECQW